MDALIKEQEKLSTSANLSNSIREIQNIIDQLHNARNQIVDDPTSASVTLARLQNPIKQGFENATSEVKKVYKGHNQYQKVLDLKFKDKPSPSADSDALSAEPGHINGAISMHFLREGQFSVASQLLIDIQNQYLQNRQEQHMEIDSGDTQAELDKLLGIGPLKSEDLRRSFGNMYHIVHEMRHNRNLLPAIDWARENSERLELRGSHLEFELCQLQFIYLFTGGAEPSGATKSQEGRFNALAYARSHFSHFQSRYLHEISSLATLMAYHTNLATSPYRKMYFDNLTWEYLGENFTKEFCSLLGLSAESPLYVAATAGAIALPMVLKMKNVMLAKRAEWTTAQELPHEVALPQNYLYHSIFVCPVSKAQTTDDNPPMMMPCGHVIAQDTMATMSRGSKFKCPYCPNESRPEEARKLFF
ncbi:uncharacterized protein KY384_001677 [Bacidia gigantensis]|uniref:uncharacterized protein n=1 Tax=Bacidia gigantensis TaxID=2732470 RepID=UPI001D04E367|nr:uncharacterized protein KY384_001677 [Bacidia gigantensis]KAG8533936.1 hypothetical protein KY384_001677 [Bacidia gigantensis]